MKTWTQRVGLILLSATTLTAIRAGQPLTATELRVVVPETGVSAVGYPRVLVRLFENGRPKVGAAASPIVQQWQTALGSWVDLNLAELEGPQTWYTAMLDTGASGHQVTLATAERFAIVALPGYYVHAEGSFSATVSPVSYPYALAVAGTRGTLGEFPADPFVPVQEASQFSIDARARNPAQLIQLGGINIIGMPAMRRSLFEIDPSSMVPRAGRLEMPTSVEAVRALHTNTVAPSVRILPTGTMPTNGVLRLPLRYVNLRLARQTLAGLRSPTLSENAVLMGVRTTYKDRQQIGHWMLDTGSPVSFISRRQALALGWTPTADEALSATNLTLRDIAGTRQWRMAMQLDKLEFRNPLDQILEFQNVTVLIQDITNTQPDGSQFALDGLIGNNLLLPSVKNLQAGGGGEFVPAPFRRVFIDGFRAELGVEPHQWPSPATAAPSSDATGRR